MYDTLQDAIDEIRKTILDNIRKGTTCPCCGTNQKLYVIALTKAMVKGLLHLVNDFKLNEEFHLTDYFFELKHPEIKSAADASIYKLVLWGLIEDSPTNTKGYYVYTQKTLDFLNGKLMLPATISTYNNVIVEESRDLVTLKGALKKDFSYAQLMGY